MKELTIKTVDGEFQVFLGEQELGLVWQGDSIIDYVSVFHPPTSNCLIIKVIFKNWLGGLHESYHDKVLKAMDETMWAFEDAEMYATFWLRPGQAGIARGEKNARLQPKKRNNENDNNI